MTGLAALAGLAAVVLNVAPLDAGTLSFTKVTINASNGDQYDPHVDDTLAAYSSDTPVPEIRYFNFATSSDSAISNVLPGGGIALDQLSDVDRGRIAFTRIFPDSHIAIMLFDTASAALTEIDATPGSDREGVAIGDQTVAFIDRGLDPAGELVVFDLTTNAVSRLTTDTAVDNFPSVSPDGNVITWEHCVTSCDVWMAMKSGGLWTVSALAATADSERNPDATATQIVFEGVRSTSTTGPNLYVTSVSGGPETELAIPGEEYNPSIRGNIIAYQHREPGALDFDLYVYDLATNRQFQITNTLGVSETLNDVTILADGQIRVVWAANDDPDGVSRNIYAGTFALPPVAPSCQNRTQALSASRGRDAFVAFDPAFGFALPQSIPLTGANTNASQALASLAIVNGSQATVCFYRAERTHRARGHESPPTELTFWRCVGSGRTLHPGSIVSAEYAWLHLDVSRCGRSAASIELVLHESCEAADWPTSGRGCHGHDDDRDDELTANSVAATFAGIDTVDSDAPQAAGCSSVGFSLGPAFVSVLLMALRRRRESNRIAPQFR